MTKPISRERKHKRQRQEEKARGNYIGDSTQNVDSNAIEIATSASAREKQAKKAALREKLAAENKGMSSKKKKRLDKYIEKKLKKDENLDLLKKLAGSKIDTNLLKSSRSLGATKITRRELLSRALRETQAGINVDQNRELLFVTDKHAEDNSSDSDDSSVQKPVAIVQPRPSIPQLGSGLKQALPVDVDGRPIIKKRKRLNLLPTVKQRVDVDDVSDGWSGLSSSASYSGEEPERVSNDSDSMLSAEDSSSDESGDGDELSEVESDNSEVARDRKQKSSAFKAWATSQFNEVTGHTPSTTMHNALMSGQLSKAAYPDVKPREKESDTLPPELTMTSTHTDRKAYHVPVSRSPEVEQSRLALPVVAEEQRIMEAIYNNATVVICGETGSGKTTQIPQFLYEAGYGRKDGPYPGMIGVTQPRRIAALSMAKRVGDELGMAEKHKVAHQIRFDSTTSRETCVKFMTDGILMREVSQEFLLTKYSAIVIDEAHERSANTDILIGLVSRIVDLRTTMNKEDDSIKPLKFIIMSATLRVQDFIANKSLFKQGPPPLVEVEGRQHKVTVHFARKTLHDYVQQTLQKVCKGHRMLPPGGMLVFLTGQDEIIRLEKLLREVFPSGCADSVLLDQESSDDEDDDNEDFQVEGEIPAHKTPGLHILPLYSQLQTKDQSRVFEPPPEGSRLIILATNVAETSLTIPGIRYVFDCGRAKEKKYDKRSGVQSFDIGWISKASASQRMGRAGRTGPGHCYRMYSSAVYARDFEENAEPEILRMPIDGLVLQLKAMRLQNVINFPFPAAPDRHDLVRAEKLLSSIGALDRHGKITPLGEQLSSYPLSPRYGKMLAVGHQYKCAYFTILMVAALATPNLLRSEHQVGLGKKMDDATLPALGDESDEKSKLQKRFNQARHELSSFSRTSDAMRLFNALQQYLRADDKAQFCNEMFLVPKAMSEAASLVTQLTSMLQEHIPVELANASAARATPTKDQLAALQQFVAAGFLDQIAILASEAPDPPYLGRQPKRAVDVPYLPLTAIHEGRRTADTDIREIAVFVHPSAVLAHLPVREMPKYVIYDRLQKSSLSSISDTKIPRTRMHPLTTLTETIIATLARGTPLLAYGKPLTIIEEKFTDKGKTRLCIVQPNLTSDTSAIGWPLPAQKLVQIRDAKGQWSALEE